MSRRTIAALVALSLAALTAGLWALTGKCGWNE